MTKKCCENNKELLDRLSRIEGHLRKVKAMVEKDDYCIDIITQSLAVQNALRAIDEIILKKHLKTCVKDAIITDTEVDKKIEEVIRTIKFTRK